MLACFRSLENPSYWASLSPTGARRSSVQVCGSLSETVPLVRQHLRPTVLSGSRSPSCDLPAEVCGEKRRESVLDKVRAHYHALRQITTSGYIRELWGSRPREGVMALRLMLFSLPRPYLQGHIRLARPWAVALLRTSRQF